MYVRTYQHSVEDTVKDMYATAGPWMNTNYLQVPVVDDLATFLRYAVFKKETDDPEKVSALISELKQKQSDYDTSRFLSIFSMVGEQGEQNAEYWHNLLGTAGLNWDSLSEDDRNEAADELMRILAERYSFNDSTDEDLLEEMEKMNYANVGRAKIERRVLADL